MNDTPAPPQPPEAPRYSATAVQNAEVDVLIHELHQDGTFSDVIGLSSPAARTLGRQLTDAADVVEGRS